MKLESKDRQQVPDSMFFHDPIDSEAKEEILAPPITFWQEAWRRLRKNKGAYIGLITIVLITIMALIGPFLNDYSHTDQDLMRSNLPPKAENFGWLGFNGQDVNGNSPYEKRGITENSWFGTDEFGRDLWTRLWKATQISLFIAIVAATLDFLIGVIYGGVSAFYGGRVDNIMQRIIEVLVGIPNLIVIILFILILEPGIVSIILAMIITGWVGMARVVRGQILQLKGQEFVLAARALATSNSKLIRKHLLPNVMGPIIITVMFTIPSAIFFEAFLSFIGLGLQPPLASLGVLIEDGYQSMRFFSYKLIFPAIVISAIMISFNLLADGLRDALDPKMRK
jgi:oligopeptide transport system permease protein